MLRSCCVCKNSEYSKPSEGISYHRFPKNEENRQLWLSALGLSEAEIKQYSYVCSDHFQQKDIFKQPSGKQFLHQEAVPAHVWALNAPSTSKQNKSPMKSDSSESTLAVTDLEGTLSASETGSMAEFVDIPLDHSINKQGACDGSPEGSPKANVDANFVSKSLKRKQLFRSPTNSRKRFFGDLENVDFGTPRKAARNFRTARITVTQQRRKIHQLQQSLRRTKKRVTSLKSLLVDLRRKNVLSENAENAVEASVSGLAAEVLKRFLRGPSQGKYSPELRLFAVMLNFYSPKAYKYIRETFNRTLPHPATISKWYQTAMKWKTFVV